MGIRQILNIVSIIATGFAPFAPKLRWAEIGADLTGKIIDEVATPGTVIVDENGVVLSKEELSARAQASWDEAIAGVDRIRDRADQELGRTDDRPNEGVPIPEN